MIARFNYTDRIGLKSKMFNIRVIEGPPRTVEVSWNFGDLPVPKKAKVYVEVMVAGYASFLRFPFGTVADPCPPASGTALTDLPDGNVHFTVKIVDEESSLAGRIVAICRNIEPLGKGEDSCGSTSILPVEPSDLGERVWKLHFTPHCVYLQVNKNIHDILHIVQNDPKFFALVFPEAIRQILYRALIIEGHYEVTAEDADWKDQWLRYAITWHPDSESPPNDLHETLEDDDRQQLEDWIDQVINSFCIKKGTANLFVEEEENNS